MSIVLTIMTLLWSMLGAMIFIGSSLQRSVNGRDLSYFQKGIAIFAAGPVVWLLALLSLITFIAEKVFKLKIN